MRKVLLLLLVGVMSIVVAAPVMAAGLAFESASYPEGRIVVANRASGSVSVIDVASDAVVDTIALPGESPEPMYVVHVRAAKRVFVGDRANNQVVVFDQDTFEVEGAVDAGNGVFHMWADAKGGQLWVNNDIDNTVTVINPRTLAVLATVPMPADLIADGGKPHDVVLAVKGGSAFVTFLGLDGDTDAVVKFDTATFEEVARAAVGKDPHVSLSKHDNHLYVPAQNSHVVSVLDRDTLEHVTDIPVPGAHGAGMRADGRVFYTTNLPAGGTDGLFAIDTDSNSVLGAVDTPVAVPHNIALTKKGDKIYVTHSGGTASTVSVYTASKQNPVPVHLTNITVGLNPFGLAYIQ